MAIGGSPQAGKEVSIKIMGSVDPSVKDSVVKAMKDQQVVLDAGLKDNITRLHKELAKKKEIINKGVELNKKALKDTQIEYKKSLDKEIQANKQNLQKKLQDNKQNLQKQLQNNKDFLQQMSSHHSRTLTKMAREKKRIADKKYRDIKSALDKELKNSANVLNKKLVNEKQALSKNYKQSITNINKKAKAEKSALNKNLQEKKAILEREFNEQTSNLNKQIAQRKQFLRKEVSQRKQAEVEKRAAMKKSMQAWKDSAKNLSLYAGIAFAATVKMSKGLLDAASRYEQYKVTLLAVTKSQKETNRLFKAALKFAPKTPFKVGDVIRASVKMKAFGVEVKSTMNASANLAAAFNTDLNEAALGVSKALKGSAMGFRILRNQYGITTAELQKYGAMTHQGTRMILSQKGALEANRKALLALIKNKYGQAIKLQMNTVETALSNLDDSLQRFKAAIGKEMIPTIKDFAKELTKIVYMYKNLGSGTKKLIGQSAIWIPAILGIATATGVLLYVTAQLVETYATLSFTMTTSVLPALVKVKTAIWAKTAAVRTMTSVNKAGIMTAKGLAMSLAGVAVVAVIMYNTIEKSNKMLKEQIKLQEMVTKINKKSSKEEIKQWKILREIKNKTRKMPVTSKEARSETRDLNYLLRQQDNNLKHLIKTRKEYMDEVIKSTKIGNTVFADYYTKRLKEMDRLVKSRRKIIKGIKDYIALIAKIAHAVVVDPNKEKIVKIKALDTEILRLERLKELKGLDEKQSKKLLELSKERAKVQIMNYTEDATEEDVLSEKHEKEMKVKDLKESMREDSKKAKDEEIKGVNEKYNKEMQLIENTKAKRAISAEEELKYLYKILHTISMTTNKRREHYLKIWALEKKIRNDNEKANEKIRKQNKKDSSDAVKAAEKIVKNAKKKSDKIIAETKKLNDETKKMSMTAVEWESEQFKERIKKLREMGVKEIDIKRRVEAEKIKITKAATKKQKDETDKQKKEIDDLKAKLDSLRASRIGGAASPIYGVEELGVASAAIFKKPSQIKPSLIGVTTGGIPGLTGGKPPGVTVKKDQWTSWKEGLKPVEKPKIENKIIVNITGMKGKDASSGIKAEMNLAGLGVTIPMSLIDTYAPEVDPIGTGGGVA